MNIAHEIYAKLEQDGAIDWTRSGRITIDELRELIKSRCVSDIMVSAGPFGLVDIDRNKVIDRLNDIYLARRLERIIERVTERTGQPAVAEVQIGLSKRRDRSHSSRDSYYLYIHTVGVWYTDDGVELVSVVD